MPLIARSDPSQSHRLLTYAAFIIPIISLIRFRQSIVSHLLRRKLPPPPQTPAYLSTPQYELAQREMFKLGSDGTRELLIPHRGKLRKITLRPTPAHVFSKHARLFIPPKSSIGANGKKSVGVNREFLRRRSICHQIP